MVGDTRTILQKAQQFKRTQEAGANKEGIKSKRFSLFNNPNFLSVASKIGVDVNLEVDIDPDPTCNIANLGGGKDLIPDRTEGSDSDFITPQKTPSDDSVESNSSELWYLVCKNRRGKHPRTRLIT